MKTKLIILLTCILLTSCKRQYTCFCENKVLGVKESSDINTETHENKDSAEEWCESYNSDKSFFGITTSQTTCNIQ